MLVWKFASMKAILQVLPNETIFPVHIKWNPIVCENLFPIFFDIDVVGKLPA
jgi:hypothetical protein